MILLTLYLTELAYYLLALSLMVRSFIFGKDNMADKRSTPSQGIASTKVGSPTFVPAQNGATDQPEAAPARPKRQRTLLQSQAAIERIMNGLSVRSHAIVLLWINNQYGEGAKDELKGL